MPKTKSDPNKAAELSDSDLEKVQGGTTQGVPRAQGPRTSPQDKVRPFVVDGPYT